MDKTTRYGIIGGIIVIIMIGMFSSLRGREARPSDASNASLRYPGAELSISKDEDLNGDGVVERVEYAIIAGDIGLERYGLLSMNEMTTRTPGYSPASDFIIVDVETSDSQKEVLVTDTGPSSDYTSSFYTFDGENIVLLGTIPGQFRDMEFSGNGRVVTRARAKILDTWFYDDEWKLSEEGRLRRVQKLFYERRDPATPVTALTPLTLQTSPTDGMVSFRIQKNEMITIAGCDDIEWCRVTRADGQEGWFRVVNGTEVLGADGAAGQFDGLSYAD